MRTRYFIEYEENGLTVKESFFDFILACRREKEIKIKFNDNYKFYCKKCAF